MVGFLTLLKWVNLNLDSLSVLPFLNDTRLEELKNELPSYMAKADGMTPELDKLAWWKNIA